MAITTLTGLPFRVTPLTNIVPFTYRDGMTYLEVLNDFKEQINDSLIPGVNSALDQLFTDIESGIAHAEGVVIENVTAFETIHQAFMDDVNAALMGLNDAATDGLIRQPASLTGIALRELFASKSEVADINTELEAIAMDVASKANVNAPNRGYSIERRKPNAKEHYVVRVSRGTTTGPVIGHRLGGDSTATVPTLDTMETHYGKTRASLMVNGGGWWSHEDDSPQRRMGLCILDGVLVSDWETNPAQELGNESAVFMKDGTLRIYDRTTPAATILADGGWNATSFGKALYREGILNTAVALEPRYTETLTARNLVGVTWGGTLLFIMYPGKTGVSGAVMTDIINDVSALNIRHLYFLDGGGSAQMWVDGKALLPSSDAGGSRAVAGVYHFTAPRASEIPDTGWTDLALTAGTGTLKYRANRYSVEIEYNITHTFPVGNTTVTDTFALPDHLIPQTVRRGEGLFSGSLIGQASVNGSGQITVTNDTAGERSQITGHILYQRP